MKTNWFGIFILLLISYSCVEDYWPEIEKYEELLVVDGMITNEPGPYTIELSKSTPIYNSQKVPYSGCIVMIKELDGNTAQLIEVEEGIYQTSPEEIQGEIGKSYQVRIVTPDGEEYESSFETIKAPVLIDQVNWSIEYHEDYDYPYLLAGYQFYITTLPSDVDTNYFLWKLEETYQYEVSYYIDFYYDGQLHPFPNPDSLFTCWKTAPVKQIFTYNTSNLSEPVIINYPLNFVSTETRRLSILYSLQIEQLNLGKKAYNFWHEQEELNTSQGSLYTQQPYQVKGNIINTDDPEEPVLGYFLGAGVDIQRIFAERPPATVDFHYSTCHLTLRDFEAYRDIFWSDEHEWPLYVTLSNFGGRALPIQTCVDCRQMGGEITIPSFWPTNY